jgi:hypothetical protein
MPYPSLEQYNQAFQLHSRLIVDSELKSCVVTKSGLGLPLAISGGFALTYTLSTSHQKFAVRCFHREALGLEKRYEAISKKLSILNSPYFLDFSFQPHGIKVDGHQYPLVKMAWAKGKTLGEFLETNYRNTQALLTLSHSLLNLSIFLEKEGVAHGDLQTGNLMVSDGGLNIQLIDYDGMYVDDIRNLGSSELGHVNFQHIERKLVNPFDADLDRFSFISIVLAIKALRIDASLWKKTDSELDAIIFRSNDFLDPSSSKVFSLLSLNSQLADDANKFASICSLPYNKIPSLSDFLSGKYTTNRNFNLSGVVQPGKPKLGYVGAYIVLDATDFNACLKCVGDKVEVIGQILIVKEGVGKNGKPYIFLNFSDWRGHVFKVSIWHDGIGSIQERPSRTWVGRWLSLVGLMEPRYSNGYKHSSNVSISVSSAGQMTILSESEARWRLGHKNDVRPDTSASANGNQDTLSRIKGELSAASVVPIVRSSRTFVLTPNTGTILNQSPSIPTRSPASLSVIPKPKPSTSNQELLDAIRGKTASSSTNLQNQPAPALQQPSRPMQRPQQVSHRHPQKSMLSKFFSWIFD